MKTIQVTCRGAGIATLEELNSLQGHLKNLSEWNYQKLRGAITGKHGFSFPFAVWRNKRKLWTVDGHQRLAALLRMKEEGYKIPPLPIDYVEARNIKEAKEKILLATSQYGRMTEESLGEFLKAGDLNIADLKELVALPEIDLEKLGSSSISEAPEPQIDKAAELQKKWKTARGQIWEIGKHRLMCGDAIESVNVAKLMGQRKAVLMATDPP